MDTEIFAILDNASTQLHEHGKTVLAALLAHIRDGEWDEVYNLAYGISDGQVNSNE